MIRLSQIDAPLLLGVWSLVCFGGCDQRSTLVVDDAVADVEPTEVDLPDTSAAERFRQATAAQASHGDWPQLFGPNRTSAVNTSDLNPLWGRAGPVCIWSIKVGTGYGSPVVSEGCVVFNHRIAEQEVVQCVNAETGESLWAHRYPTTFECDYDYSSGPYSTPLIRDGDVYSLGGQGQLSCLDLQSGELIWSRDLHKDYALEDDEFAVGTSPGIAGDRLIVNIGAAEKKAGVVALDRKTGETLWESTDHGAAYCSPFAASIHGESFLFVVTKIGLVSLHPETGQMDWMIEHRCRAPMSYNSVSPLVCDDKVLVVTGPGPGALCVQIQPDRSYRPLWKDRRVLDSQFNTLLLRGGNVFGFTAAGQGGAEFRCVDFDTGELNWKYHSLLRRGQGLIAGNAIILLGERGHLASLLLSNDSPQVLAFTDQPLMTEPCYCAPAYASGRLYLKDEERVACFDVKR